MTHPMAQLQEQCRSLRLAETAKELPTLLRQAESNQWTYHELMYEILRYEQVCREEKMTEKLLKWAKFPVHRTLDEFNLNEQRAISIKQFKQLKELLWLEQQYNIILLGPPGVGNYQKFLFMERNNRYISVSSHCIRLFLAITLHDRCYKSLDVLSGIKVFFEKSVTKVLSELERLIYSYNELADFLRFTRDLLYLSTKKKSIRIWAYGGCNKGYRSMKWLQDFF